MDDIAPALWRDIEEALHELNTKSERLRFLQDLVESGKADYITGHEIAKIYGKNTAEALKVITKERLPDGKMWFNIADRTVRPAMEMDFTYVADAAERIQETLNESAGIGLKAVKPVPNRYRIQDLIDKLTESDDFDDVSWLLDNPVKNYSESVMDDAVRQNASFQWRTGVRATVKRITDGSCCAWCSNLAGTYSYPDVPEDVYRRHENCTCLVAYNPGSGRYQNVHSRGWYDSEIEFQNDLKSRKEFDKSLG